MASGNHCPVCCPLESAQQDLFVLGMGRGACVVSTLDSSEDTAGEEFLFLQLSFFIGSFGHPFSIYSMEVP